MKPVRIILIFLMAMLVTAGCSQIGIMPKQTPGQTPAPVEEILKYAQVSFRVRVPPAGEGDFPVYLQLLDETTGLMLNPVTYQLTESEENIYVASIAVPLHSILKYRYTYGSAVSNIEFTPMGQAVRYRLAIVDQPLNIDDTISSWTGDFTGNYGRIEGTIRDEEGNPISNTMIAVAGVQTFSTTNGRFLADGIPVGTHQMVIYDLDGKHQAYQQLVTVATDVKTLADITVTNSTFVNVTFVALVPDDVFAQLPVRLVGNTSSTGNTFADLAGGISVPASRAPLMQYWGDRKYALTLSLPTGFDFRYKFTHGDGFWNAEQSSTSRFVTRQLIVPDEDLILTEAVESWNISQKAPISIIVRVPESTPQDASLSIQFRPYDWMTPIPMWQIDETSWLFVLTSPLELFNDLHYRYCLNDNCDESPEVNADGLMIQRSLQIKSEPQNIEDVVSGWRWFAKRPAIEIDQGREVVARQRTFYSGVALRARHQPVHQPYIYSTIRQVRETGINLFMVVPQWYYSRVNLPVLEAMAGITLMEADLEQQVIWAKSEQMATAVFPMSNPGRFRDVFWDVADQDVGWWNSWFDRYQNFLLHYAEFARENQVDMLILGEAGMKHSIPAVNDDAVLSDPFLSNRWQGIVRSVREQYGGQIYWAVTMSGSGDLSPIPEAVLEEVDGVLVIWNSDLSQQEGEITVEGILPAILEKFSLLQGYHEQGLKVLIAMAYPSAAGAERGAMLVGGVPVSFFDVPDYSVFEAREETQLVLYDAMLRAINAMDWVDGFISMEYAGFGADFSPSPSIRGKAAENLLRIYNQGWQGQ